MNFTMKRFLTIFLAALIPVFGGVTIPPSDIFPVNQGSILGRTSTGTGGAQQITAGAGITIANGLISATGGGGGAPTNATYITQTPNATLSAEQALSLLGSGILFNTTGTGVISTLTIGSGLSLVGSTLSASGAGSGTVTSASVVTANGVSATVATPTTTPAFTFTLGAITPTTVNGLTVSQPLGGVVLSGLTTGGAVDNTAIIQAAFPAGVARRVVLPKGTFLINTGIVMAPGSSLEGMGDSIQGTYLQYNGNGRALSFTASSTTDFTYGGRIANLQVNGTASAVALVSVTDLSGVTIENCTLGSATTGRAVELRDTQWWTEDTTIIHAQIRDTKYHYYFDQNGGTNSYAHTQIIGGQSIITGVDDRVLFIEPSAYTPRCTFDIGVNVETPLATVPTTSKPALVELGSAAAAIGSNWNIRSENGTNRNFWRFVLGSNARVDGIGDIEIQPATTMSPNLNATHPYDSVGAGAIVYISPSGHMLSGTGDISMPSNLGAGQTAFAQQASTTNGTPVLMYLTNGIFEVELRYVGTGRSHTMKLLAATNQGADDASSSSRLTILSDQPSFGTRVFDAANPPTLKFSTVNHNAYLSATLVNTVGDGTLYVTGTLKTYLGTVAGTTDWNFFVPMKFFPDMTGKTLGATTTAGRTVVTIGGNATATNGQLLIGNTTSGFFDKAAIIPGSGIVITNTPGGVEIAAPGGGSGNVTNNTTLTSGRVVLGGGTNAIGILGAATDGQILIGNTTNGLLSLGTITAGNNITVTNSAAGITINSTGGGGGNVTAASNFGTDNVLIKSDGTGKGVQATGISIADTTNDVTGIGNITVANLTTTDLTITGTITGVMPVANGGTGLSSTTAGNIVLGNNTTTFGQLAIGTNGKVLTANSSAPLKASWETPGAGSGNVTNSGTLATGNVVVGGGTTVVASSNISISGNNMTVPGNLTVTDMTTTNLTISGTITGVMPVPNGGTGFTATTAGNVVLGNNTTTFGQLAVGANGTVLTSNTAAALKVSWEAAGAGSGNVTNSGALTANAVVIGGGTTVVSPLASLGTTGHPLVSAGAGAPPAFGLLGVVGGGTGVATLTANSVLTGNGTGGVTSVAPGTNGNLLTSNGTAWTSAAPGFGSGNVMVSGTPTSGQLAQWTSATDVTGVTSANVTQGGSGRATGTTAYSLIATGTTATGTQQTLANGATTEILVGGGASALPVWTTAQGSGAPVRATSPTLTTPTIGVATATSVNKVALTAPATSATLTIADGKTLTASQDTTLNRQSSTGLPVEFIVAASDLTTSLTTGTSTGYFPAPYAFTITEVRAHVLVAQTAGSILTFDIKEAGTTILSTKITIDNNEKDSTTAATPPVVSDTAIADASEVTINIDQVGTAGAKGLIVTVKGYR